ncbi:MAG TPA: TlpA disulfide reductase family protein [Chitinophagaceae bacterium]
MKTITLTFFSLLFAITVAAQNNSTAKQVPIQLTETTMVKDTVGTVYPYTVWRQLMATGRYSIKPEKPQDPATAFIIIRLTDEQYEAKMTTLPKPKESAYFKTGEKFHYFKTSDIDGNKISNKTLAGKILVLNYWFINCPPCRLEIPELNKLAEQYKNDSSVVFIAVALDTKSDLKHFLKTSPFKYSIVDDGRFIANEYRVTAYPTNVIIDHEGKVYFHSSGFASNMVYWLEKSINEIKKGMPKKDMAVASQ